MESVKAETSQLSGFCLAVLPTGFGIEHLGQEIVSIKKTAGPNTVKQIAVKVGKRAQLNK